MPQHHKYASSAQLQAVDPIWQAVREDAEDAILKDRALGAFMLSTVLNQPTLEEAVKADLLLHVVDLANPEPVKQAFAVLAGLVDRLERILSE